MPRDYRQGIFKFVTAFPDPAQKKKGRGPSGKPRRDDLVRTVRKGIDGSMMPAFSTLSDAELERGMRQVADNVAALVQAPAGEAYSGPVLFDGVSAGQLLAQLLGKNLAFARRPIMPPGQTFPFPASELEARIGSRILPEWIDVTDDATEQQWRGRPLFGHYRVDLEGVAAQRVSVVEKGVLKSPLLTRQPVKGFENSNGHARLPGMPGTRSAGISNLFVKAAGGIPPATLKAKLIQLCRERGKPYAEGLVPFSDFLTPFYTSSIGSSWAIICNTLFWLWFVNFNLAIFNALPIYPFDGGRILDITLKRYFGKKLSDKTIHRITVGATAACVALVLAVTILPFFL
jgi:hypothetical protein